MLRAIILSLALLIGLGTIIPLATNFAEAGHRDLSLYEKKSKPKITKFSKKWWAGYKKRKLRIKETTKVKKKFGLQTKIKLAEKPIGETSLAVAVNPVSKKIVRKKRVAKSKKLATKRKSIRKKRLARKKKFAAKRKYSARKRANSAKYSKKRAAFKKARYTKRRGSKNPRYTKKRIVRNTNSVRIVPAKTNSYFNPIQAAPIQAAPSVSFFQPVVLPTGGIAPRTWMTDEVTPNEMIFKVSDKNGSNLGSASISVVGPAKEEVQIINRRIKMIGGITTTSLRRTVIDQMIEEGGWITNDYQKEIDGQKVYVVEAKSPGEKGVLNSRLFYFTEVDGEIYNVATNSEEKSVELLAVESEKVINSLQNKSEEVEQIKTLENSNAIAANFSNVFVNH